MATPRQDLKRFKIIDSCHDAIRRKGAHAMITVSMPGTRSKCATRRMAANGPRGAIIAHTVGGKRAFVTFAAAELLTSLKEMGYG